MKTRRAIVVVLALASLRAFAACNYDDGACWAPDGQGQGQGGGPIVPGGPGGYGDMPTGGGGYGAGYIPCPSETASAPQQFLAIKCNRSVDYPHASMHFPGTVNVVAHISCPTPLPRIDVSILIVGPTGNTGTFSTLNAIAFEPHLATSNCIDGTYVATAIFTLWAPPGFSPPTRTFIESNGGNMVVCNGGK